MLRGTEQDFSHIRECHQLIQVAQDGGDIDEESGAVLQYQIAVTEAAHNSVLLHLVRCMGPMLENNVHQNFQLLYSHPGVRTRVSNYRTEIFSAIIAREAEKAREQSHRHLVFIEKILLNLLQKHKRGERSLRRLQRQ